MSAAGAGPSSGPASRSVSAAGASGGGRREPPADLRAGSQLLRASWAGTALFATTAAGAAVAPDTLDVPALATSLLLFFSGLVIFMWAFLAAVVRSRTEEVDLMGLFGLSGAAPRRVQRHLLGSLALEVAVALTTSAVRPYTTLAFGILAPLYGLGMTGLWGARHGTFPDRVVDRQKRWTAGR